MKSILMSIQPKWCELIASGQKTIEVRRTAPKEVPFKVYIYCTKNGKSLMQGAYLPMHVVGRGYNNISLSCHDKKYKTHRDCVNGKIIGEFVCDKVDKVINHGSGFSIFNESEAYTNRVARQSGLYFVDLKKYLETKDGYAWHITDLKVYDEPKELSDFRKPDTSCVFYNPDLERCDSGYNCERCVYNDLTITRPPQSWQYVEEVE